MSIQREALEAARKALSVLWGNVTKANEQIAAGALAQIHEALSAPAEQARQTGYVAPVGRYVPPVLFSPYTGEPRDARDISTDPQGRLIVPPGAAMLAAAPSAPTAVPWDASMLKQPGWHHVMQAFIDGACEARCNPDASAADFGRAADGYTKRVHEALDPIGEEALRTESWAAPTAVQPCSQCGSDPHKMICSVGGKHQLRLTANEGVQPAAQVQEAGGVEPTGLSHHLNKIIQTTREIERGIYSPRCEDIRESARLVAELARAAQPATPVAPKTLEALTDVDAFLGEVRAELVRARTKFPGDRIMTIALAEEFGELCKAVLDESAANVRKEAVQTAVMAARVVLDGDGSVREWRAERGLDALATKNGLTMGGGDD